MGIEGSNYAATTSIAGGSSWLEETENLAIGMQATRYLALSTIDLESKYVWSAPWNFGRVAFHFNRFFAPMIQIVHIVSLFRFRPSPQFCIITSGIYTWGTCVIVAGVMSVLVARVWLLYFRNASHYGRLAVLVARVWLLYFRKPWILIALLTMGVLVSLPPILVILVAFKQDVHININPAPDVIPGCLFAGLSKWSWIPYLGSTLYEVLLFILTVYKVYTVEYELPIINRLYRDGTYYFVVVLVANVFTMAGSRVPLSQMYLRWLVPGFLCSPAVRQDQGFESKRHERIREQAMSISETIRVPRPRRNQGSSYWGIIEVDRTTLYITNSKRRDSEEGEDQVSVEDGGTQLATLPIMYVPGGPGLRSGWIRRDSEGEVVVH
ncbi:unnamed protein product [Rhizoctonia solani]|uniref:DUF6533 domain-containing protein n=1 Tax=Rhizoctonia solani TaxID=456999 RepID=A0A8H2XS93_9AGAM|nr:unnamed protein product [Rhizoctonia solani]